MHSGFDGSLPGFSSGPSVPSLDGALLVLSDRVVYSAVAMVVVALLFASAHSTASYSVFVNS